MFAFFFKNVIASVCYCCWMCRFSPVGNYLARHRPPTGVAELWYWLLSPGSPVCRKGWPAPLWWQTYSGHIDISGGRVVSTWLQGRLPGVSVCPPPLLPSGHPPRQQRGGDENVVGDRHQNNNFFLLCSKENFLQSLMNVWVGVYIHGSHVDNEVYPLRPHVLNHQVYLQFGVFHQHRWFLGWVCPGQQGSPAPHGATWVN